MRSANVQLRGGESVLIYAGDGRVVLQVRRLVHGHEDPAAASSFKSGVTLDAARAVAVAAELLRAAGVAGGAVGGGGAMTSERAGASEEERAAADGPAPEANPPPVIRG